MESARNGFHTLYNNKGKIATVFTLLTTAGTFLWKWVTQGSKKADDFLIHKPQL